MWYTKHPRLPQDEDFPGVLPTTGGPSQPSTALHLQTFNRHGARAAAAPPPRRPGRDEIDASHYPAFHQCEGVRLFDAQKAMGSSLEATRPGVRRSVGSPQTFPGN